MAKYNLKDNDYWQNDDGTYEDEDGIFIFRTVGGKTIRIHENQSLPDAMKKSGKFESAQKGKAKVYKQWGKSEKELDDEYDKAHGTYEKSAKELDDEYDRAHGAYKKEEDEQREREKKAHRDAIKEENEERYNKLSKEDKKIADEEEYEANKTMLKEMERRLRNKDLSDEQREKYEDEAGNYEAAIHDYEAKQNDSKQLKEKIGNDVKKLQDEAHKRGMLPSELQDQLGIKDSDLGLKDDYTEKFEREMQGMERYLKAEEAKKQSSNGSDPNKDRETFNQIAKFYGYNKMDNDAIKRTLDEAEKKGMYHSKNDIEAMRRYLDRTVIEKDTGSAYSKPGKRWEVLEESKSAYGDKIYKVRDENGDVSWQKASKFYEKSSSNNNAYKKAFEDYKKKHPNTKLTLNKFIDMSEGK